MPEYNNIFKASKAFHKLEKSQLFRSEDISVSQMIPGIVYDCPFIAET
jgi:hypothetical protein